jgi:6-phosphogluconolactonase (cycloisomerase 2 family)
MRKDRSHRSETKPKATPLCLAFASCLLFAALSPAQTKSESSFPGAVFAATNASDGNSVIMYKRLVNGRLQLVGSFPTGGRGEGGINDPLQSESSLFLSPDDGYLLAVNAGSSTISVFRVLEDGLLLLHKTPSGGGNPVSVTMHGDLVYVANFGGVVHTSGFRLLPSGVLDPIPNSKLPTSALDTEVSTIAFSPDGYKLVLSERQTNKIDIFSVQPDGTLANPVFNTAVGNEPFGLQFTALGQLLVTTPAGALTSYWINDDNTLTAITTNSPSSGGATCWVVNNGTYAWVSNAVSSTLSAFTLSPGGALGALGVVATVPATNPTIFPPVSPPTSFPIDLALSADSKYLYTVFSALGEIVAFRVGANGQLTAIDAVLPYPAQTGVEGLAAY